MSVTSTTLAGVNVWRFSGAVTDAEVKTAWASINKSILFFKFFIYGVCSNTNRNRSKLYTYKW